MNRTYQIYDPLYGEIRLPDFLRPFIEAPEFRRLGFVRLLNFESVELAALSEVRRLSHTLGVLHLGTRLSALDFSSEEMRALLFAIILHDIGTPPFGHSLEYEFVRRYNLDHEAMVMRILDATHDKLSLDHQIFRGSVVELPRLIASTGVADIIRLILEKKHPISEFLSSTIDLDNIDNVYRMAFYLGCPVDPQIAISLTSRIEVDRQRRKYLFESDRRLVEDWLHWRSVVYRIILNSSPHRRNQAIFSRILYEALEQHIIDDNVWFHHDESLLRLLEEEPTLKKFFRDLYLDQEMHEVSLLIQTDRSLSRSHLLDHRDALTRRVELDFGGPVYVAFVTYGEVMSRRIEFIDRKDNHRWTIGEPKRTY